MWGGWFPVINGPQQLPMTYSSYFRQYAALSILAAEKSTII